MSSRDLVLEAAFTYSIVTIEFLCERIFRPLGLGAKTVERAVAFLQRDGLLWCVAVEGRRKIYGTTAKAARLRGRDERRYARPLGPQALAEARVLLAYWTRSGHAPFSPHEFAEEYPAEARCQGMSHSRYFIDKSLPQPLLTLVTIDFGGNEVRRICRKVRREVERRKQHEAWETLIYNKFFCVTVLIGSPAKAARVVETLRHETFPHSVAVVPEILDFK